MERDLLRSQDTPHLEEAMVIEVTVEHTCAFEGRNVGDLNLPAGCLILTVTRGVSNQVARADTVLQADDRLSALIAPEAAEGVTLLRDGCSGGH